MRIPRVQQWWVLFLMLAGIQILNAQGTAFFYQGNLNVNGAAANGEYDLKFALYDATTNGNLISFPQTNSATGVTNGLFTATLDFGSVFTGTNYWLSIGVRTNGNTGAFTLLWPRQPVLPTPYAIFANTASNLIGTLGTTQLVGTLPASAFAGYTNTVAFTNSGNVFSGNGAGLTTLNASQITSGTLADARLTTNVALLNASQTFTGSNTFTGAGNYTGGNKFTNWNNSFTGSFFGNGLVGWLVETGSTVQASVDAGFILMNSNLTTVTLPTPINVGDIVRISGAGSGGWRVSQTSGQSIIGLFRSYGSSYWSQSGASSLIWTGLCCSVDGSILAATVNDASHPIYVSKDGGRTWTASTSINATWKSIACSSDGNRIVAGQGNATSGGTIYVSTNTGSAWVPASGIPTTNKWYSIALSSDGSKVVAVANGGGIYRSTDGGFTWSATGPTNAWQSVASSANGTCLAAGGGVFYVSTNSGNSWTSHSVGTSVNSVAMSADGSKLAATSSGGGIYTSSDFGVTWKVTTAPNAAWTCIASSADGAKLVATVNGGGIYTSDNFGATWAQSSAKNLNWVAIAISYDGTKLAAAVYNGPIYYFSAGTSTSTTTGTTGDISGPQGSAVELQYIGNNTWMPVSSVGTIWAN